MTGAYFSFLMEIKVELEEQIPLRPNWPLASVRARIALGWLARATKAPATGTPVTVRTSPCNTWLSHTHRLQSSLGWPSMHTRWHLADGRQTQRLWHRLIKTKIWHRLQHILSLPGHGLFPHFWTSTGRPAHWIVSDVRTQVLLLILRPPPQVTEHVPHRPHGLHLADDTTRESDRWGWSGVAYFLFNWCSMI